MKFAGEQHYDIKFYLKKGEHTCSVAAMRVERHTSERQGHCPF